MKTITNFIKSEASDLNKTVTTEPEKKENVGPSIKSKKAKPDTEKSKSYSNETEHNNPVLVTRYEKNLEKLAKYVVAEMLSDSDGNFDLKHSLNLLTKNLTAKDLRPIPSDWPQDLISEQEIREWADTITYHFESVYQESGDEDYAQQLMAGIFAVDVDEDVGLPDQAWNLCVKLDKQAIEQCLDARLNGKQIDSIRRGVIHTFLLTHIILPHLRPPTLRYAEERLHLKAVDISLCNHYAKYFDKFIEEIRCHSENQLSPGVKALLESNKSAAKPYKKTEIEEIMGEDFSEINKLGRRTGFLNAAQSILESNPKNPQWLLHCLFFFYKSAPKEIGSIQEELWENDVQFFFKNRVVIDALPERSAGYFYGQLDLMGTRHRSERAGDRNIARALNIAIRMPHEKDMQEADEEEA